MLSSFTAKPSLRPKDNFVTVPITDADHPVLTMVYGYLTATYFDLKWERIIGKIGKREFIDLCKDNPLNMWMIAKVNDAEDNTVLVNLDLNDGPRQWCVIGDMNWCCYWKRFDELPKLKDIKHEVDALLKQFVNENID